MFKRKLLFELGDNYFLKYDYFEKKIYKFESLTDIAIDNKSKKAAIMLSGEEANISILTLPKVKSNEIYTLIKNELYYSFRNTKNLLFAYTLFKETASNSQFVVFCINTAKFSMLYKSLLAKVNISHIYILQLCVLNYFKRKIKIKDYVLLFKYKANFYFLLCINNILIYNNVIKIGTDEANLKNLIYVFIDKSKAYYESNPNIIYCANIDSSKLIELEKSKIKVKDLGAFEEKQLFNSIIANRR